MGDTVKREDREDRIELEGVVTKVLPQTIFEVTCGKAVVIATLSGRMRKNRIKILEGDNVRLEVSPYDLQKGRVTRRL